MQLWHVVLYGVATVMAVRSLSSLMAHHRLVYRQQILNERREEQRRQEQLAKQAAKQDAAGSAA